MLELLKRKLKSVKAKLRTHEVFGDFKYRYIIEGILTGFLTGTVVSMFRMVLGYSDSIRTTVIEIAKNSWIMTIVALALLGLFAFLCAKLLKLEPMISGSGIPQVKGELEGYFEQDWRKVLQYKFLGGFLAITGGLSLGREGPSIQLGAMVGKGVSELSRTFEKDKEILMMAGAGAGLACAFSAPLAGVMFTIEELEKKYSTGLIVATMAASITSDTVASYLFGLSPVFTLNQSNGLPISRYWEVFLLGILLGFFGVIYNKGIEVSQNLFDRLGGKGKIIIPYISIVVLALYYPQILGSGHGLVAYSGMGGHGILVMLILLIIKFVFSIMSFGTGAPGGIFLPLLVMGAIAGATYSELLDTIFNFSSDYLSLFVILGMAGFFSAIVRAPLTGIVLISEMTGLFSNLLPISIVVYTAYVVADFNYGIPIYDQLLDRMLKKKGIVRNE